MPLCSSACLYSWPSTNSSVKSFVPRLIVVAVGVSAACGATRAPAAEPRVKTSSAARSAVTPRTPARQVVRLTILCLPPSPNRVRWTFSCRRGLRYPGGDIRLDRSETFAQRPRCHDPLEQRESEVRCERERGDGDRRGDHAFEEVARLVDDDVAEPAAADDAAQS